jgi:fucose permease
MIVTQERYTPPRSYAVVAGLTYAMFFMFAMTTDAVGEIIKLAKEELGLSLTQASAFHWATMVAIAASGMFLGFLADRMGRKAAIILGLGAYGVASALFMTGRSFELYVTLLFASGLAIGVFKTAALALIGDLSSSTQDHTKRMNLVEGFFAVGAIVGPLLVVFLSTHGISWTYLYLIAATLCGIMIVAAAASPYPQTKKLGDKPASPLASMRLLGNRYALGFSAGIGLYVACEVAIFVWLPTFLAGYQGGVLETWVAAYAVMIFFVLRAIGRFMGVWILNRLRWQTVMAMFSGVIFALFLASALLGKAAALYLLPASGLFMSMIYPTLNSKGISCFPKSAHGAVAGVILFFTAFAAAIGPLLMAYVADAFGAGDMQIGFWLATGFAAALFAGCLWNWLVDPAASALAAADRSEYADYGVTA